MFSWFRARGNFFKAPKNDAHFKSGQTQPKEVTWFEASHSLADTRYTTTFLFTVFSLSLSLFSQIVYLTGLPPILL